MRIRCLASSPIVVRKLISSVRLFGGDEGNVGEDGPEEAICYQWRCGKIGGRVGGIRAEDSGSHTLVWGSVGDV
ncbi:hypothetical protein C7212DRAFT_156807 [Tuber magnatum]|uniref:Uncharacterized protein n=1 Tax=Tuber magnatum TaxID=42249 RepID=A0A317SZK2_9PEZI|nr:hypothetical protein C7212DRAFT_156807 [Tuber magnatum]